MVLLCIYDYYNHREKNSISVKSVNKYNLRASKTFQHFGIAISVHSVRCTIIRCMKWSISEKKSFIAAFTLVTIFIKQAFQMSFNQFESGTKQMWKHVEDPSGGLNGRK